MTMPELFFWLYIKRLWNTLYEPRKITAAMIASYVACVVAGAAILLPVPTPTTLHGSLMVIEAITLILTGLIGAPSAWSGKWLYERIAIWGFVGVPATLLIMMALDVMVIPTVVQTAATVGGTLGIFIWLCFGLTRMYRIHQRPYAPGKGPVPVAVQTREVDAFVAASEEAIKRTCGRG